MRPLLFVPSPRDIKEVKEAIDKLKIDKLIIKYFSQPDAYYTARDWFLEHTEYTHLVIHPDDLIATQEGLDRLSYDAENIDVVSGWSNNTSGPTDDQDTDFSLHLPPMQTSSYDLYMFFPIDAIGAVFDTEIVRVMHQGTALTFLPRTIVEDIPFRTEFPPDLCLSHDLHERHIEQYVDLKVRCLHLRHPHGIMVGKKQREIIFEKNY